MGNTDLPAALMCKLFVSIATSSPLFTMHWNLENIDRSGVDKDGRSMIPTLCPCLRIHVELLQHPLYVLPFCLLTCSYFVSLLLHKHGGGSKL